jgi:DNA-binding NarL/FixJ family response regulator
VINRIRLAVLEDHPATRAALALTLAKVASIEVIGTYSTAEDLLATSLLERVQIALIDLQLPGMSGQEAIGALAERASHVRAIALTVSADEATVMQALNAGAHGYLVKGEPTERIVAAIEEAAVGEHPVSSRIVGFLLAHVRKNDAKLSGREEELVGALSRGLSYGECAVEMQIEIGTVQSHVKSLYRKLRVRSRKEVREWLQRNGRVA